MAKYRCYGVEARLDGSGMVSWDIEAVDNDTGTPIPGHHGTVLTPQDETAIAVAAGIPEVKDLLRKYAPDGWDDESLDDEVVANRAATETADGVDDFVDGYGGYPIDFSL